MQDFFAKMMEDPAIKAGMERQAAERKVRAEAALARHGSVAGVFAETPQEALLREACAPFLDAGGGSLVLPPIEKREPGIVAAIERALPFPGTVAAALAEYDAAEARSDERSAVEPNWSPPEHCEVRRRLLARILDTLPASSFADVTARVEWMQRVLDLGYTRDIVDDQACLDALKADMAAVGDGRIPVTS